MLGDHEAATHLHNDVTKWNIFRVTGPLCGRVNRTIPNVCHLLGDSDMYHAVCLTGWISIAHCPFRWKKHVLRIFDISVREQVVVIFHGITHSIVYASSLVFWWYDARPEKTFHNTFSPTRLHIIYLNRVKCMQFTTWNRPLPQPVVHIRQPVAMNCARNNLGFVLTVFVRKLCVQRIHH